MANRPLSKNKSIPRNRNPKPKRVKPRPISKLVNRYI